MTFQKPLPNAFDPAHPLQGPWSDPVHPQSQGGSDLDALIGIPTGTMPEGGWPVIIYGHGLTASKETALTFAGRATAAGFAVVAVDFVAHGSRAVRISKEPTLGCTGRCVDATTITAQKPAGDFYATPTFCETAADCPGAGDTCGKASVLTGGAANEGAAPTATTAGQCYDPFLSTDLAKTRDGLRQSVLDLQRVVLALKACGPGAPMTSNCGGLAFNPTKILYTGVSLGGILGSVATAESPDIKAAMLSVPGAGWLDLLENTDTVEFRCPLVNGLIDAGILSGTKWTGANTDALCLQDKAAWQGQPGYATFAATARWILDPADPANFGSKLATKRFMIQEVIGDTVVPNVTTERLAALTGVAAKAAMADAGTPPAPSAAITTPTVTENKFIRYMSDVANKYTHSSFIRPADLTPAGVTGFLRMQVDARTWLEGNK
jgi:dienelactone hydrolase